jgi:hypothetical protein
MIKKIFLFILILPMVNALAVSPTTLNLGEIERGEVVNKEVMVVNNLGQDVDILFRGMYYNTYRLDPFEKKVFTVPFKIIDEPDGDYIEYLYIQEELSNAVANAIGIKIEYRVLGGDYSYEAISYESPKKNYSILGILAGVGILGVGIFGYVKKKKKK